MFLFSKSLTFQQEITGVFLFVKQDTRQTPDFGISACTLPPAAAPWHLSFEQSITANRACIPDR